MNAEERYLISCYGLPADMMRIRMVKDEYEVECHTAAEVQAMLEDGYKLVPKTHSN